MYDYEEHKDDTGIYMIKCLCNGMVYVGATSTSFKYRKQDHMSKLKNGKHQKKLQSDYDKYGVSNFVFEIVAISRDSNEIKSMEMEYILQYKEMNLCYNEKCGGEVVGNKVTEETRRKMSESHKGHPITEYQKEVIRNCNKGRKMKETTKRKLSEYFAGSKSNFATLDEDKVADIKKKLIGGVSTKQLSDEYGVDVICIDNIRYNYRWKHVKVDGWDEYQNNRQRKHKLTKEEEDAMLTDIVNGMNNNQIHNKYHVSYDKIKLFKKNHSIDF